MVREFIPLSVPNLKGNELKYITEAIESEWVSTAGSYVESFEKKIAEYVDVDQAISCQNGTAGLHISLLLSGVKPEDEVIVPTLTFIASVNPVKYLGANPVFMDCDDSLGIDPKKLANFCENECIFTEGKLINKQTNKHIKAIVVVHVFGNMADMESIMHIAEKYNLMVVEDAAEALGTYYTEGKYEGEHAGTVGDFGVYSFNGNKIMTTGGGGMIVAKHKKSLERAKHLTTQAKSDDLYYTHDEIGYNYRMTNLQAALGLAQLEQLETFISTKRDNYLEYYEKVNKIEGLRLIPFNSDIRPNYWFYALYVEDGFPLNRDELMKYLRTRRIETRPVWGLISDQLPYEDNQVYQIEKAREYIAHVVNIPCSSNLKQEEVEYIIETLNNIN